MRFYLRLLGSASRRRQMSGIKPTIPNPFWMIRRGYNTVTSR
jgi:hypothetical protein